MIRRKNEQRIFTRSEGVNLAVIAEPNEIYDSGRLYAKITLDPGASITPHRHINETESFYIVKGICKVMDNDKEYTLYEGDTLITLHNECHSIKNETDEPTELIALIISTKQGIQGISEAI